MNLFSLLYNELIKFQGTIILYKIIIILLLLNHFTVQFRHNNRKQINRSDNVTALMV